MDATTTNTLTVLRGAEHLIERGWCKHDLATTRAGRNVDPTSPTAAAWCLRGALIRAAHDAGVPSETVTTATSALFWTSGAPLMSPVRYNDHEATRRDDVLRLVRDAIAKVEGGEIEVSGPLERSTR